MHKWSRKVLNWVLSFSFLYWIHVGRIRAWHLTATAASGTKLADSLASHGLFKPASKWISILPPLDFVNLSSIIPDVSFRLRHGASSTMNMVSVSVHQTMRVHIKEHAAATWLSQVRSWCWWSWGSSDLAKSCCVSSASEVVLGVKAAWELASSGAKERVTRWDAGTVEADAAAGGAGDTVFVDLADGLGPSTAL